MKYFSMPADFKKETIDAYEKLGRKYNDSQVIETYGNITLGNRFESGRTTSLLPPLDWDHLKEYVEYSRKKGIDFSYTMNGSHMHNKEFTRKGIVEIMNFLAKLSGAGVRSITVALPTLMEILQFSGYDMRIKASVICQVTTPNKAAIYKKMGIDRIVVDESLNRDFSTLERIRQEFGDKIEIIVNSICHKDCNYRMFHYNQIAGDSLEASNETAVNYYNHRCLLRRYELPENLLKLTWVRPEDIKYYTRIGICYFKLQGRHTIMEGDPVRAVECYFKESHQGDLLELLDLFAPTSQFRTTLDNQRLEGFIKPFYEKKNFCKNHCSNCGYCENFAGKCIDPEKNKRIFHLAENFYNQYDQFKKILESVNAGSIKSKSKKTVTVDFNID